MDFSLYNIEPQEFKIIDRHEVDDNITYDLEPVEEPSVCETCGFETIKKHGTATRHARDLSEHAKKVGLVIHSHRYYCLNCQGTWTPPLKSIDSRAKMTNRMRDYIRKQSLKVPFSRIKDELDVSVPTIKGIFGDYVAELDARHRIVAPKVLGMDENHLNGQYRCIYTDIENGLIIDMTSDRSLTTVSDWIARLPGKDRIECVTIDMWGPYKSAVISEIPDVPIVIDKFHVIKNLNEALDGIRKGMRDSLTEKQRKELKNSRWLLLYNNEDLDDSQRIRLSILLTNYPQFKAPYDLKERFRKIYKADNREHAEKLFDEWKIDAVKYPLYSDFVDTVENWHTEIFNYFDHHYTNAVTESLNKICKEIAAVGRGYTFDVLRAKILYGTKATKPAKFVYYQEKQPDALPTGTYGFVTRSDGIYQKIAEFALGDKKKRRIETSSGVDVRLLQYYLELGGFWDKWGDKE